MTLCTVITQLDNNSKTRRMCLMIRHSQRAKTTNNNNATSQGLRFVRIAVTCVATQSAPPQSDREYKVRTTKYELWIALILITSYSNCSTTLFEYGQAVTFEQRKTIVRLSHQESTLAEGKPEKNSGTSFCATVQRWRLRVASGATVPGPALEGAPRFRPKVVLMSLSSYILR